jgi:hypothetical protein
MLEWENPESMNNHDLIHGILNRPRMYSSDIETPRDLLMFLQGVYCGLRPPHGARNLARFGQVVNQRLGKPAATPWVTGFLETYGNPSAVEICGVLAQLYQDYLHSLKKPDA